MNSQDGISLIQTAEGGMQTIHNLLQRKRELAVQSASGTNTDEVDRAALDLEFQALKNEIDDIVQTVTFNNKILLDGRYSRAGALTASLSLSADAVIYKRCNTTWEYC
jgi:flagellin